MSHVACDTAFVSSSRMSSISSYSALSVCVQEVDVPTMRYPARAYSAKTSLLARTLAGVVVETIADQWEAAADLLGDDRLEAVPLEHPDRGLGHVGLVVVHRAAVEVDDGLVGSGAGLERAAVGPPRLALLPGRLERSLGELRERSLAVDTERHLECRPHDAVVEGEVGDGREQDAHRPDQVGLGEAPVAQLGDPALAQPPAGLVVHLGDLHAGRAGGGAPAAAVAVVNRVVRGLGVDGCGPGSAGGRRGGTAGPGDRSTSAPGTGPSPA